MSSIDRPLQADECVIVLWLAAGQALLDGNPSRRALAWLEHAVQCPVQRKIWLEYRRGILQSDPEETDQVQAIINLPIMGTELWDRIIQLGIRGAIECASEEQRPQIIRVASSTVWNPTYFFKFVSRRSAHRTNSVVSRGTGDQEREPQTPAGHVAPGGCTETGAPRGSRHGSS